MESYELDACSLTVSAPTLVGSAAGHHWFSSLHLAGGDDILGQAVLSGDEAQGEWPARLYLSQDMGRSWSRAADIDCHGPVSVLLEPGRLLFMPYELWPLSPGDRRNAAADGTSIRISEGAVAADRVQVKYLGFPRDLADYHEGELNLLVNGSILPLRDGRLFATLYGIHAGRVERPSYECFAVASEDRGFTWHYLSHVASWEDTPTAREGPDESNTARLKDGRLMCVYRVGGGREQHYHASYSSDEGVSWTKPAPLPDQWSVEPQLVCLDDGTLLLSGGRPGIFLWVDRAGTGESWEAINLAAHHNATCADPAQHFHQGCVEARAPADGETQFTTSYTCMKQIGTNEVLISYDRLGNGWRGGPGPWGPEDSVFVVRVLVDGGGS